MFDKAPVSPLGESKATVCNARGAPKFRTEKVPIFWNQEGSEIAGFPLEASWAVLKTSWRRPYASWTMMIQDSANIGQEPMKNAKTHAKTMNKRTSLEQA